MYEEVYADSTDVFDDVDRFTEGLDGWSSRPGWSCVIGYDGETAVGYAYGAPLPEDARWWGGLLTKVPADVVAETGTRTYAFSELTVRPPGAVPASATSCTTLCSPPAPRNGATLLVDQEHPKVLAPPCTKAGDGRSWETSAPASPTLPSSTPCCSRCGPASTTPRR
ncbi:hypothetical protein ACFXKS_39465 [Streptomyces scopuliridis]|uniref:hypothetical protein n=1 Tax=Streptomyces scopuliridis TaxID=452529 RepID=UPI0036D128F7